MRARACVLAVTLVGCSRPSTPVSPRPGSTRGATPRAVAPDPSAPSSEVATQRAQTAAAPGATPPASAERTTPSAPTTTAPDATLFSAARDHERAGMIRVPAGRFTRGCNDDIDDLCEDDERPARALWLREFWIDRLEVTLDAYAACVHQGACRPLMLGACAVYDGVGFRKNVTLDPAYLRGPLPVTCVSWSEARAFCRARGKRLPSEAEWEKAARGIDRRRYPWGDWTPSCVEANTFGCAGMPEPVGGHPFGASPYGVHDMAGNVWEWTEDWYDERYYRRARRRDPQGPDRGRVRVVRGGSFYDDEFATRASYRYGITPHSRINFLGFRCARSRAPG